MIRKFEFLVIFALLVSACSPFVVPGSPNQVTRVLRPTITNLTTAVRTLVAQTPTGTAQSTASSSQATQGPTTGANPYPASDQETPLPTEDGYPYPAPTSAQAVAGNRQAAPQPA